jgi:hypothetical protein
MLNSCHLQNLSPSGWFQFKSQFTVMFLLKGTKKNEWKRNVIWNLIRDCCVGATGCTFDVEFPSIDPIESYADAQTTSICKLKFDTKFNFILASKSNTVFDIYRQLKILKYIGFAKIKVHSFKKNHFSNDSLWLFGTLM